MDVGKGESLRLGGDGAAPRIRGIPMLVKYRKKVEQFI